MTRPVFILKPLGVPDASASEEVASLSVVERSDAREVLRIGWVRSTGHLNTTLGERAIALSVLVERFETGTRQGLTSAAALNAGARHIAADPRWDFTVRKQEVDRRAALALCRP
ncbi:hypothetical protein [Streptomyces sp. NPDC055400]